jgi:hypothetical protein
MTSEQQQRVSNVFISHSNNDRELATTLERRLDARGIRGFLAEEVRRWDIPVIDRIRTELTGTQCLVCILSEAGMRSASVNQEIGFVVSRGIHIIPMIEEGVQRQQVGVFVHGWDDVPFTRERFDDACDEVLRQLTAMTVDRTREEAREREEGRIAEVRAREDNRKDFRLDNIRTQSTRVRNMLNRRADLIDEFLNRPNTTLDEWNHIRENMGRVIGTVEQTIPSIQAHFAAIDDLLNRPILPLRFSGDLDAIYHWVNQVHDIRDPSNDPTGDPNEREELMECLEELRQRVAGFEHLLDLLEQEVPARNRA